MTGGGGCLAQLSWPSVPGVARLLLLHAVPSRCKLLLQLTDPVVPLPEQRLIVGGALAAAAVVRHGLQLGGRRDPGAGAWPRWRRMYCCQTHVLQCLVCVHCLA